MEASARLLLCPVATARLPRAPTLGAMTPPPDPARTDDITFHGEVWTDGRGYATIRLPAAADSLSPPLEYELRDLEPASTARVTAELVDGHFTIATEQPHVKVAWRITHRSGA